MHSYHLSVVLIHNTVERELSDMWVFDPTSDTWTWNSCVVFILFTKTELDVNGFFFSGQKEVPSLKVRNQSNAERI